MKKLNFWRTKKPVSCIAAKARTEPHGYRSLERERLSIAVPGIESVLPAIPFHCLLACSLTLTSARSFARCLYARLSRRGSPPGRMRLSPFTSPERLTCGLSPTVERRQTSLSNCTNGKKGSSELIIGCDEFSRV